MVLRAGSESIVIEVPENLIYRSYMVRLWHEPRSADGALRGEVEHIQSGNVVNITSLEEIARLLNQGEGMANMNDSTDVNDFDGRAKRSSSFVVRDDLTE